MCSSDLACAAPVPSAKRTELREKRPFTNQQLISTLDEVMKIQQDGAQKRREAELELGRIEGELKQKLLELRG